MQITKQLYLTLIGIFVFALGNLAFVFFTATGKEGTVVNQSGLFRGGTQRLVKLELAGKPNDQLINKLDNIVKGLINGDDTLNLPPATEQDFLSKMQVVNQKWNKVKTIIQQIRKNPQSRNELLTVSEELFTMADEAVKSAENISQAKVRTLRILQIFIFVVNVMILVGIGLLISNISSTLKNFTGNIASSSTEIAATVEQQERTIIQQANSVNATTTTMDEFDATSRQAAEQAESSATQAQTALNLVEEGTHSVHQTIEGMANLKEQVIIISEQITYLSEQTSQIVGISDVVANLTEQTNLLALNASVEAMRVGEQGKGFAIVSGEIRRLADQSRDSLNKINRLVLDIQNAMNSTLRAMNEGTQKAQDSINLTEETAKTFAGVKNAVKEVFLNSQQISLNAKQQATAVQQVLSEMNIINLGSQETTSGINQVKSATRHLDQAAKQLQSVI